MHVLTLTATPIPRTLQMALSGVREMSVIATPPVDRLAVRTFVLPFDGVVVREAILREKYRGGQIFYVCPRLQDMPRVQERLEQLVPEIRIAVAHGQMSPTELEDTMTAFGDGAYDVLLSTNIIESGLDMPRVNTIIIHRADMFGLGQLYQLRGRVGRGKTARLCLSDLAAQSGADQIGGKASACHADARQSGRGLHSGQPRSRYPRRRQSAGRRAIGPYPRSRRRALPDPAGGSGGSSAAKGPAAARRRRATGRRRSRSAWR